MNRTSTQHRARVAHARTASGAEIAILILVVAMILTAAALPAIRRAAANEVPRGVAQVRVRSGETLWQLAERHPVAGLSTAELVEVIVRDNAIEGTLAAGQLVKVPAASAHEAVVCQR